jgi:hypothetical protein
MQGVAPELGGLSVGHTSPHTAQLLLSVDRFTQVPPHDVYPLAQTHTPLAQAIWELIGPQGVVSGARG